MLHASFISLLLKPPPHPPPPTLPPYPPSYAPQIIFARAREFGGGLFALAASVVADLIHHDPLVYRTLDEAGLPQVGAGVECFFSVFDWVGAGGCATRWTEPGLGLRQVVLCLQPRLPCASHTCPLVPSSLAP